MTERGIIFSAPMVRALLAGAKTQTRRVIKLQPKPDTNAVEWNTAEQGFVPWRLGTSTPSSGHRTGDPLRCPYGAPGDRLWVREAHAQFSVGEGMDRLVPTCVAYRATCAEDGSFDYVNTRGEEMSLKVTKWTSPIHMPRWAARITLEITEVRAQRLHEITELDAAAEGVDATFVMDVGDFVRGKSLSGSTFRNGFEHAWKEINGANSWTSNPWVWALTFKRIEEARHG